MSRPPPPAFYQYVQGSPGLTPGAMIYGFESEMLAVRPWIGPAIGAAMYFTSVFRSPQNYQAASVAWNTGLTGVVHGQNILQPLSNPYDVIE